MKCCPSGKNCGKSCSVSCRDLSNDNKAVGSPPVEEMRNMPELVDPGDPVANAITPSRFQSPPMGSQAVQSVIGGPPVTSIFLRVFPSENAMKRASGDQTG